ncbi:MAG: hypothetical protein ACYTGP_07865 [Planctomycetota bacterium]|jgi:hypothetical protein
MRVAAIVLVLSVLACGGCETTKGGVRGASSTHADGSPRWPFWPTDMRIHPLTRIAADADGAETVIEARLELVDEDGHTTKGVGVVTCELISRGDDTVVAFWELDLNDRAVNRERYDEVTRTYLIPLELNDATVLPERPELRARFASTDGQVFEAKLQVRRR